MALYLLRRLLALVAVLLVMSFIVFCLQRIVPSDPARAIAGPTAPAATVEQVRERLGLNEPLLVQYGRFLAGLADGDLGTSTRTRKAVTQDLLRYGPASLELMVAALLIGSAAGVAVAFGQVAARRGEAARLALLAAGSVPIFLSALLLVLFFWFHLGWLPGSGRLSIRGFSGPTGFVILDGLLSGRLDVVGNALSHLVLPAVTLAIPIAVAVARSLAGSLRGVLRQSYVRTARGNGLGKAAIIRRHGLRNAAAAPLAMVGLQVGLLFSNLLIVESIFAWPGLGLYTVQALGSSDLSAVLGVAIAFGALYILINAIIDILQTLIDPRVGLA